MDFSNIPVYSSFFNGILIVVSPFIAGYLFWGMIKFILHRVYSLINVGLTPREERKGYRNIDNIVDGVSNVSDVVSLFKSDKSE